MEQQKLVQDLDDESKRNAKLVKQVGGLEKEVATLRNELSSRQVDLDRALNELAELRRYKESHSGTVKDLNNDLNKLQRKGTYKSIQLHLAQVVVRRGSVLTSAPLVCSRWSGGAERRAAHRERAAEAEAAVRGGEAQPGRAEVGAGGGLTPGAEGPARG